MSSRAIVALAALLLVGAFAAGRYSVPEKVRIETRTIEVHGKTEDDKKAQVVSDDHDLHHEVVVTELVKPDGTRETTTRTVTDNEIKRSASSLQEGSVTETTTKDSETRKEVTAQRGKLDISLLVGASPSFSSGVGPLFYGLHISRPLLGPISMGLWGLSSGTGGVSLGLQF